jgi:hypothetical protein
MHFQVLQNVRLLLAGSLKPDKCLVVLAECDVRKNKRSSRNVACLPASFQFVNQTARMNGLGFAAIRQAKERFCLLTVDGLPP